MELLAQKTFPETLKVGRVIPIHKSGSQKDISNFRPITTLSVYSKIFEKLVHTRLSKFISKYNLINDNQFSFQKNKNTSDAILEFLDNIYDSLIDRQLAPLYSYGGGHDNLEHKMIGVIILKKIFKLVQNVFCSTDIYDGNNSLAVNIYLI